MSELHRHVEVLLVQVPAANTAELHTEWGNGYLSPSVIRTTLYSLVKGYGVFFCFFFPPRFHTARCWMKEQGGFKGRVWHFGKRLFAFCMRVEKIPLVPVWYIDLSQWLHYRLNIILLTCLCMYMTSIVFCNENTWECHHHDAKITSRVFLIITKGFHSFSQMYILFWLCGFIEFMLLFSILFRHVIFFLIPIPVFKYYIIISVAKMVQKRPKHFLLHLFLGQ